MSCVTFGVIPEDVRFRLARSGGACQSIMSLEWLRGAALCVTSEDMSSFAVPSAVDSATKIGLAALRAKAGLTQRAVAAALGLSPGNYNEIEAGKRPLPAHHIGALAQLLQVTPRQIVSLAGNTRLDKILGSFALQAAEEDAALIPVFGRTALKPQAQKINLDAPQPLQSRLPRPGFTSVSPRAFVLQIIDDALAPRYRINDVVLVDPDIAPQIGDDCVVRDAEGLAHVKCLLAQDATHLTLLEQFNPKRTIKVPVAAVAGLYRILARLS